MKDKIGDLIRRADPSTVHRGDPLSERGREELAFYEAIEGELTARHYRAGLPRTHPFRPLRSLVGASATALVGLLVLVLVGIPARSAVASTPHPLDITPLQTTVSEVLEKAAEQRETHPSKTTMIRETAWILSSDIAPDGSVVSSSIEPTNRETTFHADGSVRYIVTIAPPFPGQRISDTKPVGTVLIDEIYPPGTHDLIDFDLPTDPKELESYFKTVTGEKHVTTAELLQETASLKSQRILSPSQESAILRYMASRHDLKLLGKTIDRAGRNGIVLKAENKEPGENENILIISPESGQILAFETLYIGTSRNDITSPAVIDYSLWQE